MIPRLAPKLGSVSLSSRWPTEPLTLTVIVLHSVLVDETADNSNDLYIRSVCFSPDGKLLATGAEDKTIRVSHGTLLLMMITAATVGFECSTKHDAFSLL